MAINRLSNFSGPLTMFFKRQQAAASLISVGTTVAFNSGDYFDAFSQRSGVTTTDAFNTNNGCWQLYYAHRAIRISTGTARIGLNPHTSGTNSWDWRVSVSTVNDTIGSFGTPTTITNTRSGSYTGGAFVEQDITVQVDIPANRYFLIGNTSGPFFRTIRSLAQSRTAVNNGQNIVTAINRVFLGNWPAGGTTAVPTQLGGAGTSYTEYTAHAHVHSVRFTIL